MASQYDTKKQRRFDLSMSRRTRKPVNISQESTKDEGHLMFQQMSLQELMADNGSSTSSRGCRADLAIEEEKTAGQIDEKNNNLAIVPKKGESGGGVKIVEMVGRYVKTLNYLIKAKHGLKKKNGMRILK
ncbi:hypothetical protein Cni_G16810 [Canna indica]|uniref:Uncharacterized protein n=1 Tax=Canna indica TaxID=4628 RepID=A0AAQ3KFU0_9LILI|nr:hypothetical protein Cni_G16810 [Canna indica]